MDKQDVTPLNTVGTPFALEIVGVGRTFGALEAIKDVSMQIAAGERRAVLGANGAGKTTLFNAITGDFPPTSGSIRLFGEDITHLATHERIRRGLRRTYQQTLLFMKLSVRDNLFLALRGVARRRYSFRRPGPDDTVLDQTEMTARFVGLHEVLHRPVGELSHGQQRQLEIGMALAGAPRFLLLDEPAAGLSAAERMSLVSMLNGLPRHIGFIIIEHDLEVALKVVDSVTIMHNGTVFKEGSPSAVQEDPDVQSIYLGESHR
ncbi:MAG: ABC transporter ATP-binding protein [Desulfobacterales bacterium]|nr:MAG: ABC transporter ATP-binding protein [Desulfobacterales bacterium]